MLFRPAPCLKTPLSLFAIDQELIGGVCQIMKTNIVLIQWTVECFTTLEAPEGLVRPGYFSGKW